MVRPVAMDFEMRPKRSHFERAEIRMLSTMASVESGTTWVPVSCLGLLWFHWCDVGKQTTDCLQMPGRTYFQGDSASDPNLGVAENRSKTPLWIVWGMQPELKAWRDGMDERLRQVRTILKNYIGDLFDQASNTAVRFELFTVEGNSIRKGWDDQNTLKYRVRLEKNTLMLEWYQRVWKRDAKGNRTTEHHYIRKRNKNKRGTDLVYGYDMGDLFKFAPEWSRERVVEVETEAASLRRQAHYCSSMLVILGRMERYLADCSGVSLPEEGPA